MLNSRSRRPRTCGGGCLKSRPGRGDFSLSLVRNLDTVTGPSPVFRLLGDRAEVDKLTETLGIVINRDNRMETAAQAIRLLSERVPVLAFVDNPSAGDTPEIPLLLAELAAAVRD